MTISPALRTVWGAHLLIRLASCTSASIWSARPGSRNHTACARCATIPTHASGTAENHFCRLLVVVQLLRGHSVVHVRLAADSSHSFEQSEKHKAHTNCKCSVSSGLRGTERKLNSGWWARTQALRSGTGDRKDLLPCCGDCWVTLREAKGVSCSALRLTGPQSPPCRHSNRAAKVHTLRHLTASTSSRREQGPARSCRGAGAAPKARILNLARKLVGLSQAPRL